MWINNDSCVTFDEHNLQNNIQFLYKKRLSSLAAMPNMPGLSTNNIIHIRRNFKLNVN